MDNFISLSDYDASIHRDILDALLRKDTPDRAVAEMRSYLNKSYDCDAIFSARGTDRHALILMFAVDIAVFHIFSQHNPYKIAKIRQDRYDRAIEWLKGVMEGDVTIDGAPLLPADTLADNSRWQVEADEVRPVFL